MKNCNFCIHEDKIFDLNGYEIIPDEDGIVAVFLNGLERRFKIDKMIVWLKESGYKSLFKEPKKTKPIVVYLPIKEKLAKIVKEPKPIKEKVLKVKKAKIIKAPKPKKEKPIKVPKVKKEPKPQYQKVEFDKRKLGNQNGYPKRKIECSNGKIYNSIIEAQKEIGVTRSQIWHVLTNKWKQTHNLTFKYL